MTDRHPAVAVVLAAGGGTRMKSQLPKVLHPIAGRPMLAHAIDAARGAEPDVIVVVVRHARERVVEYLEREYPDVLIADQDDVPGTGRAAQCGIEHAQQANPAIDGSWTVMISAGDTPLLTGATLKALRDRHEADQAKATLLTAIFDDPTGYGRILRDEAGRVTGTVEEKDATEQQRAMQEINTGVYAFELATLRDALANVGTDNVQGEMYLTDVSGVVASSGGVVSTQLVADRSETDGVNDRAQLAGAAAVMNQRITTAWMKAGVGITDPATTWVDADVVLEPDCQILPGVQLHGQTVVKTGATVGPDSTLTDVVVGEGATVVRTHAASSTIGAGATVGPFTHLRPGSVIGDAGKAGSFVEMKNATLGTGSKAPHLAYVGDAEIGADTNIGCASVFVNYDGVRKHRSVIGDHVRIGSSTMLIAPLQIGDGAYTAAGTVVRRDIPPGALAYNVAPQRNVDEWVLSKRPDTASARAAREALGDHGGEPSTANTPDN